MTRPPIRGITISVNYGPLLRVTLARNLRHLVECVVVTSPEDAETQAVARAVPGVRVLATDAFRRHGASFNKGLMFEEGFDFLGRDGWIMIFDADILLPDQLDLAALRPGMLHGAPRRILEDASAWTPDLNWRTCPRSHDGGPIGYLQLFDAADPAVRDKRPWYDVSFAHAGGGDAYFMAHWHPSHRRMLPFDVLHLGPKDRHWFGTSDQAKRVMDAFVIRNGWSRAARGRDHAAASQIGEITDRVQVPGYPPSSYELPFVRRAQQLAARQALSKPRRDPL